MYEVSRERVKRYERIGALVVILASVLFHFLYEWTGIGLIGAISPVNESVWEHTKIVVVPYLLYAVLEFFLLKIRDFRQFVVAKAAGAWSIVLFMISFFYTYSGIFGENFLIVDILSAFAWAILAFVISFRIMNRSGFVEKHWIWSAGAILLLLVLLIVFTYAPPHIPLFQDSVTGGYGIPG